MAIDFGMKVLVVDDFNVTRKMEAHALKSIGFSDILEAEDGQAAIELLQDRGDIGLIISDWNMPRKNGYELLVWVRESENHKTTPFIMATAQAEKKEAKRAEDAGVNGFISKPFTAEELKTVIEGALGGAAITGRKPGKAPSKRNAQGKVILDVAHIQITDHLVLGVLKNFIDAGRLTPKYFDLKTHCMKGWNPVQQALEKGEVDIAFTLAPIAMDLFSAGVPIKLILFAHKNGSICVRRRKEETIQPLESFFRGRVFYLPHVLSIHHMLSRLFFKELGLNAGFVGQEGVDVAFEVIPPVTMPELLQRSDSAGGFLVAQPIGRKAIEDGGADLLFLSGELWNYHPCCVVAAREEILESSEDAVYEFTEMLVQAGAFAEQYPGTTARIAVDFLDPDGSLHLSHTMLEEVLKEKDGIKTDDLFPMIDDLDRMQRYMAQEMKVGSLIDLERFIEFRYAEAACGKDGSKPLSSTFGDPAAVVERIRSRLGG